MLKTTEIILSQFGRLEVQNQSVSRAMLPLKTLGKNPPMLLQPQKNHCGSITPLLNSVFTWPPSLCVLCIQIFHSSSDEDISHACFRAHPHPHPHLN